MPAQAQCTLDGYTFTVNAPSQQSFVKKSINYSPTLGSSDGTVGGFFTIRKRFPQDRTPITLSWPILHAAQWSELDTIASTLTAVTFTDWNGNSFQVLVNAPTYVSVLRGAINAYTDVKLALVVVSGANSG